MFQPSISSSNATTNDEIICYAKEDEAKARNRNDSDRERLHGEITDFES